VLFHVSSFNKPLVELCVYLRLVVRQISNFKCVLNGNERLFAHLAFLILESTLPF
jgi:hypothetical protein